MIWANQEEDLNDKEKLKDYCVQLVRFQEWFYDRTGITRRTKHGKNYGTSFMEGKLIIIRDRPRTIETRDK